MPFISRSWAVKNPRSTLPFACGLCVSITTHSGIRFWPLLPNPGDILIEDVAHSLAHQCRFAGHTRVFYSVAEHSVRVSQLCAPEDALWGLLHDASEAYLSDIPAPLKELLELDPNRAAERALQRTIAARFGLSPAQPVSVGEADRKMLHVEVRDLLEPLGTARLRKAPNSLAIQNPWQPRVAKTRFLSRFRELCRKM